jgi:hypothetical protein
MKRLNMKRAAASVMLAMSLGLGTGIGAAWGSMPVAGTVSGTVTSASGGQQIIVDGKSYDVDIQGPALGELAQVHTGDKVDLILNGPPGAPGSKVIDINVRK